LHSSVKAKTKVARDEADRHARRLQDLERQQKKMLQLYYRDGISIEVMQQEQTRIKRERAEVKRRQQIAVGQIEDIMEALTPRCYSSTANASSTTNSSPSAAPPQSAALRRLPH
jgi:hypothetical protein